MKIDNIIPSSALPDTPVLLRGEGLAAAQKLLFGDESVPFKVNKSGGIEADVPSGTGTVDVTVEQEDGDKSNSVSFTFLEVS